MPAPSAWGRSVGGGAAERVATAQQRILELRKSRDQEAAQARASIRTKVRDGMLVLDDASEAMVTEPDVEQRRKYAERQVRDRYAVQLKQLQQEIAEDRETLSKVAAETRPSVPEDAVAQQHALMAWEQSVKPRLEAGALPSEILAGADVTTALALAEWGPSWVQARGYADRPKGLDGMRWEPPDTRPLTRAVDARLAELDEDYADFRTAVVEAERVSAATEPVLAGEAGTSALNGLDAAIAGHYAGEAVAAEHGMAAADGSLADGGDAGGEGAA